MNFAKFSTFNFPSILSQKSETRRRGERKEYLKRYNVKKISANPDIIVKLAACNNLAQFMPS
jgi:hypothetical protein